MAGIDAWWEGGERIELEIGGVARRVFVRRAGEGPVLTLLHGFPSSSHDWEGVAERLDGFSLVMPDFLGFGASDKPVDHRYSIHEQADLVAAVWEALGVKSSAVAAHDYAVSVTQELLARGNARVTAVVFLNGGLYPDVHRPEPMQTALLDPVQGPQISAMVNAELVAAALEPTFPDGYDHAAHAQEIWHGLERDGGARILHELIVYMNDRREHERRWVGALQETAVPLSFVWGMLDPISGAHMADRIREHLPDAPLTALEDVGHWPPLEAPGRVAAAVREMLAAS